MTEGTEGSRCGAWFYLSEGRTEWCPAENISIIHRLRKNNHVGTDENDAQRREEKTEMMRWRDLS